MSNCKTNRMNVSVVLVMFLLTLTISKIYNPTKKKLLDTTHLAYTYNELNELRTRKIKFNNVLKPMDRTKEVVMPKKF